MSISSRQVQWGLLISTLVVYGTYAIFLSDSRLVGDEARYLDGAAALLGGHFVSPENPEIINGPGYPVLLAPMVSLGFSLEAMRAANAVLMALASWFSYRATAPYAGRQWALGVALAVAFHPMMLRSAPHVLSEGLATFCIAGFGWAATTLLRRDQPGKVLPVVCVLALAWLVLTRVLFGYVLVAMILAVLACAAILRRMTSVWRRAFVVLVLAFAACVPYLAYTYQLTGQVFKWSTNGGELLYWATSTNPGERGNWFSERHVFSQPELARNHAEFFRNLQPLPALEREAAFRMRAMENIQANPVGVLGNWVANVNRLFFGFPRSFHLEEALTTLKVLVQIPILLLGVLALFCMAKWPRQIQPEIWLLSGLTIVYLGLSSVLPALPRYFVVVLPWIGIVTAATLGPRMQIRLTQVPREGG